MIARFALRKGGSFLCLALCAAFCLCLRATAADPADELFTNRAIRHLSIEIGASQMKILRAPVTRNRNAGQRPSVPAMVHEGDLTWTNVAVHLKGSLGSFRTVNDKPALTLNFNKGSGNERFHGLQKISLNNSVQDLSFVSEKICRELYAAAGVPVPRVDYATVELNGRNLGLFVLAEGWNKQFLGRYFKNVKGNFYDLGGGHDVDKPMDAAFGENPTNHSALEAVAAAANLSDPTQRLKRLRATLDLDRFLSLHALDILMWNWDGYAMGKNNYRMFHDLDAGRLVFLPHGVDQMFWKANGPIMTGRSGLVARSILETSEGRLLYLDRFRQLRSNIFNVRALTNRIEELTARLQPALKDQGLITLARQREAADELSARIVARARDVDAQLDAVREFVPIPLNTPIALTNWTTRTAAGDVRFTNSPGTLRIQLNGDRSAGAWITTLWLEEGRYRLEGRARTLAAEGSALSESGAVFRVWSHRKETRGASWGWFPYSSRDSSLGGLIPVATNTTQRLTGDTPWTTLIHEFDLRQPLADLQIQCSLHGTLGAAWFDLASLKLCRVSLNVGKTTGKGD